MLVEIRRVPRHDKVKTSLGFIYKACLNFDIAYLFLEFCININPIKLKGSELVLLIKEAFYKKEIASEALPSCWAIVPRNKFTK